MSQLKVVPRLSVSAQARRAIAEYRAEQNGRRRLSDEEIARIDDLTICERINGELVIDHYLGIRLSWRDILDCKVSLNIFGAADRAKSTGYRFFSYAGTIYFVPGRGPAEDTGLLASDIH